MNETPPAAVYQDGIEFRTEDLMSKIVFHLTPEVDITRLEVEYEMSGEDITYLTSYLTYDDVDSVEFIAEYD